MNSGKVQTKENQSSFIYNDEIANLENASLVLNEQMQPNSSPKVIVIKEVVVVQERGEARAIVGLAIIFVGTQIGAALWKRYHAKSFMLVSIGTLLFFPLLTAILSQAYFFIGLWAGIALLHFIAFQDVLMGRRPKVLKTNVYDVYRSIFQSSLVLSIGGYFITAYGFFKEKNWIYRNGVVFLMYILYFTLVIRTCLDIISDRASGTILPSKATKMQGVGCPMCTEEIKEKENTITLKCNEKFHTNCLKNWKILGKKDMCPSCKEKTDLSQIEMNPWQKNEYLFTKFLDFTGNLIFAYAVVQGIVLFF